MNFLNFKTLNDYGRQQLDELKKAWINGKLTRAEYEHELLLMHEEGIIGIEIG